MKAIETRNEQLPNDRMESSLTLSASLNSFMLTSGVCICMSVEKLDLNMNLNFN